LRIITIANQKGGVGKTTSCVTLGGLIASSGYKVLLLDVDPHGSTTIWFGLNPEEQKLSTYTLFQERKELTADSVRRLIIKTDYDNLDLMPATTALATLERQAIGQDAMGLVITKSLACIADDYDFVLIDTPPILGVLMVNALAVCTQLLIPVQTEFLALKGLERMVSTLSMISRSRHNALDYLVVPVMYDRRTQASVTSLQTIRTNYPNHVWFSHVPIDTRLRDASKAGVPPHVYDPRSRGLEAYRSLWNWLQKSEQERARDMAEKIDHANTN
jgi:chromosome partitioning protein